MLSQEAPVPYGDAGVLMKARRCQRRCQLNKPAKGDANNSRMSLQLTGRMFPFTDLAPAPHAFHWPKA